MRNWTGVTGGVGPLLFCSSFSDSFCPCLGCLSLGVGNDEIRSTPAMLHLPGVMVEKACYSDIPPEARHRLGSTNGRKLIHDFMSETAFWGVLHGSRRFLLAVPVKMLSSGEIHCRSR